MLQNDCKHTQVSSFWLTSESMPLRGQSIPKGNYPSGFSDEDSGMY
jgi:hypothetical protein